MIYRMILTRLLLGLGTLFVVSLLIFFAVETLPGDLAQEILGQSATPETVAAFRKQLGLDLPAHIRYYSWLSGVVSGDMGTSLANGRTIASLISARLENTMFLAALAAVISVPLALFLGIVSALYRNSFLDKLINTTALTAISTPEFFVAYILILFLSVKAGLFPSISNISNTLSMSEFLYRSMLPALTLTLGVVAHMMRMTRAAIINLLASPYIEMAHLKGLSRTRIILHHALPNALAPIINVVLLNLAYLIVGVVIVVYPGMGQLLVDSVANRDLPVVQACSLIFAATYILLNLLADVLSVASNPRLLHPR